jgi:hypothetical protein
MRGAGISRGSLVERRRGRDPDRHDRPERLPPAERLTKCCAKGNAEHVGQREAGKHHGDRPRLLMLPGQISGDDGAKAEEGAVAERGHDPGRHQRSIGRGNGAQRVADNENSDEQQQRRTPIHTRGRDGKPR